ncbi:MAG: HNH endonuclease [Chloroflexi bacterium]|nr:HNH endonuclease [Chloroflexota bacterium]
MTISARTRKILWGKASATCSFPGCACKLIADETKLDDNVVVGVEAHIVAQAEDGPRGNYPPPGGDIDGYENLILLCSEHHTLIDGQPRTYTLDKLLQMKRDHERWVSERLSGDERFLQAYEPTEMVTETIHSTLLPVSAIPRYVYLAPCSFSEDIVKDKIVYPRNREIMLPFITRGGSLIAFRNLRDKHNPFHQVIDASTAERHYAPDWWEDPDLYRWYVTLLNRALNKLTGRKGLNLDKDHSRYYFEPREGVEPRSVTYQSLTGRKTSRQVAWRPKFRHTGELKNYWEHFAVGLRFHRVTQTRWCLSIRPERRFTRDGYIPLTPKGIGRRSTSRKSRMYNVNVLTEVNFWRDYLSDGSPRIIFKFGSQNLIVQTEMMSAVVRWPGVPDDSVPFEHVRYEDDLFTYAEYQAALERENDDFDEWEDEDYAWGEDYDE